MNKQDMLALVKEDGRLLRFGDAELVSDKDIVLKAAQNTAEALAYASILLRSDRTFFLKVLESCGKGCALQYAAPNLWGDREVVLQAVKQNGLNLQYASKELRADKEIVLEAVKSSGLALADASEALRGDPEIIQAALQTNEFALEWAAQNEIFEPVFKANTWKMINAVINSDVPNFDDEDDEDDEDEEEE